MGSLLTNIILGTLVIILGILLITRQRRLRQLTPPTDLERMLVCLGATLAANRSEGKIQKVASQLSDILINNLGASRILFFRNQHRFMEINYVYGLKDIQRAKYRIRLSQTLIQRLTTEVIGHHPEELSDLLGEELVELLKQEKFNLLFPIFWMDNVFGVYFISTRLKISHPIVRMFLLFLNQNLSAAYQIKRLESSRQILEQKVGKGERKDELIPLRRHSAKEAEDEPGHLIEMFAHRRVDELMTNLFERVKTSLQAQKLIFISPAVNEEPQGAKYAFGVGANDFKLDGKQFDKVFGRLQKQQVYGLDEISAMIDDNIVREQLGKAPFDRVSTFSFSENKPGLLLWSEKTAVAGTGNRLLPRLERIAQRAFVNAREFERMEEMSYTDSLTRLYNRRYFVKRLHEEIQRATRYRRGLGLLLFDIDDFKLYNDNFGHQCGDELLRRMGETLSQTLRAIDVVSRYGGDEFCIIMPEAGRSTCRVFMDRLRFAIASADFRDKNSSFEGKITISIGGAIYPDDAESAERLIYCADMALLRSKALGRDHSALFSPEILQS